MKLRALLTVLLALAMAVPVLAVVSIGGFSDVPADSDQAVAISTVEAAGLMRGYADGKFQPDRLLSPSEAETVAERLTGRLTGLPRGDAAEALGRFLTDLPTTTTSHPVVIEPATTAVRVDDVRPTIPPITAPPTTTTTTIYRPPRPPVRCDVPDYDRTQTVKPEWVAPPWGLEQLPRLAWQDKAQATVWAPDPVTKKIRVELVIPDLAEADLFGGWHQNHPAYCDYWLNAEFSTWGDRAYDPNRGAVFSGEIDCPTNRPERPLSVMLWQSRGFPSYETYFNLLFLQKFDLPHCEPASPPDINIQTELKHPNRLHQVGVAAWIFSVEWTREGWDGNHLHWEWRITTDQHQVCQYPYPYERGFGHGKGTDENWWMWRDPESHNRHHWGQRDNWHYNFGIAPCLFFVDKWRAEIKIDTPTGETVKAHTAWCPPPAPGKTVECATG